MSSYVAFLRGINVGGHKKIAMPALRELFEGLGYTDVRTHLQSGNVVFGAGRRAPDKLASDIAARISRELGLDVGVVVRDARQLASVVGSNPLGKAPSDGAKFFVTFLGAKPQAQRAREVEQRDFAPDRFWVAGSEVYVWCENGAGRTKLSNDFWERQLKVTATMRNWNTVTKVAEMTTS